MKLNLQPKKPYKKLKKKIPKCNFSNRLWLISMLLLFCGFTSQAQNITINFKDGSDESFTIAIYSLLGQKVFERQNTNNKTIEVQNFSKGTYLIKITKDSKTLTKKLIIN